MWAERGAAFVRLGQDLPAQDISEQRCHVKPPWPERLPSPGLGLLSCLAREYVFFLCALSWWPMAPECDAHCWLYCLQVPEVWDLLFPGLPFAWAFRAGRGAQTGDSPGLCISMPASAGPDSSRLSWGLGGGHWAFKGRLFSSMLVQQKEVQRSRFQAPCRGLLVCQCFRECQG